jgi:hypothetical protein
LSRGCAAALAYAFCMPSVFARWSIAAIIGAGAVALQVDFPKDEPAAPIRHALVVEEKVPNFVEQLRTAALSRQIGGQPFAPVDWRARRPVSSPSPVQPSIPKFPFRFAGLLHESGGAQSLYVARGNDIFPIRVGELIEGFRIDTLHDARLDVTFVASGQRLSVPLSSLSAPENAASQSPSRSDDLTNSASADAPDPQPEFSADVAAPQADSAAIGRSTEPGARLGANPTSSRRLGTEPLGRGRLGL